MKKVLATWEKRNLGVNAAVVSFDNSDLNECGTLKNNLFYDIDNFAKENDIKYFTVKFPAEFCNINECLQKNHFIYAETQLTFSIDLQKLNFDDYKNFDNSDFHCEEIDVNDSKNKKIINTILDDISSGLFYTDRISVDEKFGLSISSVRYVNWFNDMINGDYHLFVTFNKDEIVGFNIDKIDGVKIGGGLVGILKKQQGKGYGSFWMYQFLKYLQSKFSYYETTSSSNNIKILKIWTTFQGKIVAVNNYYYKHL